MLAELATLFLIIHAASAEGILPFMRKKEATLVQVSACPGNRKAPIVHEDFKNVRLSENTLNATWSFEVMEDINEDIMAIANVRKCTQQGSAASCENFKTLTMTNYCQIINTQKALQIELNNITPAWRCPIKKGVYKVQNFLIDVSPYVSLFPDGTYKAKCEMRTLRTGRLLTCLNAEGKIAEKN